MAGKVLLVSPVFQGYYRGMEAALGELGFDVHAHVYDRPKNIIGRIKNKALHELPENLRPSHYAEAATDEVIAVYRCIRPDIVITIKGDQLHDAWWDLLESDRVRRVVWMYDERRRMRFSEELWGHLGPICTYSSDDAQYFRKIGLNASHVPLGFDTHQKITAVDKIDALTFIGARYANREELLREIQSYGIPVKAYGRQWSRNPIDIMRTRQLANPGIRVGRDLERGTAYGVMAASVATLNIHGDQDGFTMRTFEACGSGAAQIVDRAEVSRYFEPNKEVLVATNAEEMAEAARRLHSDGKFRNALVQAGAKRARSQHSMTKRLDDVVCAAKS